MSHWSAAPMDRNQVVLFAPVPREGVRALRENDDSSAPYFISSSRAGCIASAQIW